MIELADYLEMLNARPWDKRGDITLPGDLLTFSKQLAETSEQKGLEHGTFLLFDPGTRQFSHGQVVSGHKDHMDIPRSDHPNNFGDVHGHPSKAVGHDGGYSAHSPDDLKHFGNFKDRDSFIQFVAAGPMVYAMIYLRGESVWNDDVDTHLDRAKQEMEDANSAPLWEKAGGHEAFLDGRVWAQANDEEGGSEKYTEALRKQVPNYGKIVEQNSLDFCTKFAKGWGYQFVTWKRTDRGCVIL